MVVRTINSESPDVTGNVNIQVGAEVYGSDGKIEDPVKMFVGIAEVIGNEGRFNLDVSAAEFTSIDTVQLTVQSGEFSQANSPLSANFNEKTSTNSIINGKVFKTTSAGLLAAMQQTPAESGTKVNVFVLGK